MNSRKLMKILRATSYDLPNCKQPQRNHTYADIANRISIQEAIARYIQAAAQTVVPVVTKQPRGNTTEQDKKDCEQKTQQYMAVMEVCQIANERRKDAKERVQIQNKKKKQRRAAGTTPESRPLARGQMQENAFDRLDVNRTEGHLLYSYDKKGTHSILGKDIAPGGYGDRITNGSYADKA